MRCKRPGGRRLGRCRIAQAPPSCGGGGGASSDGGGGGGGGGAAFFISSALMASALAFISAFLASLFALRSLGLAASAALLPSDKPLANPQPAMPADRERKTSLRTRASERVPVGIERA